MKEEPRGPQAAHLRQRKFQVLRLFPIPPDLLPGTLTRSYTRCGNPRCHCAHQKGHEAWTLTFMVKGQRHVERIPRDWVEEVERRVAAGREFQDAVREVLAANAQLLVLARQQRKKKRGKHPLNGPTPRRLCFGSTSASICIWLLTSAPPAMGAAAPRSRPKTCWWSTVLGTILRQWAFLAIEALVGSQARRNLTVSHSFGDDALGYFTERLDPKPTRAALAAVLHRAKRNKAFENCRFVGLALDGTTGGRRRKWGCPLCRPYRNADREILGYRHHLVMAAVVGGDLTLPVDVEPYGPRDSEYRAGQRLLRRVRVNLGARFIDYVVVDGGFAPPRLFCTPREMWVGRWWPGSRTICRNYPKRRSGASVSATGPGVPGRHGSRAALGCRRF